MAEQAKVLSHAEQCDEFKAKILGLSKDTGFANMNNLDEKKLRAECINIIHVFEGFTGKQAGQNRANFMKCSWQSIILCVIKVVSSKYLTIEKKLGLCFLVPQNIAEGENTIMTLSFGYPAYQAAALAHGISINVQTVREGDTYSNEVVNGQPTFTFKQAMFGNGAILGYVAYSIDLNGFKHVVPMTIADITKRKKVAKTDYVWNAWEEEMSLKTPLLRLCNVNYRHLLAELLEFDTDNDYEGLSENDNKNALTEGAAEKQPLTEEEKTALKESLSIAETRDLAMIELGKIELVYKERDTEISAKGRKYLIETFIDSRFNADGSPKSVLETTVSVEQNTGTILITPYKPTAAILKEFGACKTIDDLNDRINLEITDLTLNNYDTTPFMEYATRLREAFNMKTK